MDSEDPPHTVVGSLDSRERSAADWIEPVSVLSVVGYLLLAVVFGFEGLDIAALRLVAGVALLAVLPGYLLLSLLGLADRSAGRVALYSVGLSVPVVVAIVLVVNFSLPAFAGIDRPLTPESLTAALSLFVLTASAVRYSRGLPTRSPLRWLPPADSRKYFLLLSLLPVYSVVGSLFMNAFGYERFLIALLVVLSIVPLLLTLWRGSPSLYPYAIWTVAISVSLQMTLVSGHLWGSDIHYEFYTANTIFEQGFWDLTSGSLVSITLLAAVYSMVTDQTIVWVYKVVYPLLVSMLPVGIWYLSKHEFTERSVAVLAPFVFVFYYGFFKDMPDKQLVAELFAVLLLVAALDEEIPAPWTWVLVTLFAVGMVLSHYGVSLLFLAFLLFAFTVRYASRGVKKVETVTAHLTRPAFVGFFGAFWLIWYRFTDSGTHLFRIIGLSTETIDQLLAQTPTERSGADYATMEFESLLWVTYWLLHLLLIGLIGIGILRALHSLYANRETPRTSEFAVFSVGVFGFLFSSVVFTFGMGFDRALLVALAVLSPFAVVGLLTVRSLGTWVVSRVSTDAFSARVAAIPVGSLFAVLLAVFLLFSSGTAFAVAGQDVPPYSINLNQSAGWPVYDESEVTASRWVMTHDGPGDPDVAVYNEWQGSMKSRDGLLMSEVLPSDEIEGIWLSKTEVNNSTYVYVSHKPMVHPESDGYDYLDPRQTPFYEQTLSTSNKVYSSGNASIYRTSE